MNLTSPIPKGAAHAAQRPGDTVASLLRPVGDSTGLFADDSPDRWLGILMSGLSGVATALAVAIILPSISAAIAAYATGPGGASWCSICRARPVRVQTAARGQPKSLRSVRTVAPGRSRRFPAGARRNAQPAERRLRDPLSRALSINGCAAVIPRDPTIKRPPCRHSVTGRAARRAHWQAWAC
jgi:hypothetical protein